MDAIERSIAPPGLIGPLRPDEPRPRPAPEPEEGGLAQSTVDQMEDIGFQQFADSIPQIVWAARPDGHVDYFNNRWREFTGLEECEGESEWTQVVHPDDAGRALRGADRNRPPRQSDRRAPR